MKTAQEKVRELREEIGARWPDCPAMDAWAYLVTEVGELGDALLRLGYGKRSDYVRNNEKVPDLGAELGDVYLMLCTLATAVGLDLEGALTKVIYQLQKKHRLSHEEVDKVIERIKEDPEYGIPKFE